MKTRQYTWQTGAGWSDVPPAHDPPTLVFVFGGTAHLRDEAIWERTRAAFPRAHIVGCSTAGEILNDGSVEDALSATAVWFERTHVEVRSEPFDASAGSRETGLRLAKALPSADLAHVIVFSDGLLVNGSELVAGMTEALPQGVAVTGGLAGDGPRFQNTQVIADAAPQSGVVAAVGLYGRSIRVGYGSLGGWDPFGPERVITRSDGNILYELDRQPALGLYKRYLGDHAKSLPSSGLLFPLSIRTGKGHMFVRTILAVSENDQSLTFAGDMPPGAYARLMKANFDRLVDGAFGAARTGVAALGIDRPELALLISCVGRRLVLGQRVGEEVDAVRDVVGRKATITGFYSYGEVCPAAPNASCELHNQTMTITVLREG